MTTPFLTLSFLRQAGPPGQVLLFQAYLNTWCLKTETLMPKSRLDGGWRREKSLAGLKLPSENKVPAPAAAPLVRLPILFAWRMAPPAVSWNGFYWLLGKLIGAKMQALGRAMQGQGELGPPVLYEPLSSVNSRRLPHLHLDISPRQLTRLHQPQPRLAWGLTDHAPCPHPHDRHSLGSRLTGQPCNTSSGAYHSPQKNTTSPAKTPQRCSCFPALPSCGPTGAAAGTCSSHSLPFVFLFGISDGHPCPSTAAVPLASSNQFCSKST